MIISHLAVVLILCGAVATALFREDGSVEFKEGEARQFFRDASGTDRKLGFTVRLDNFSIDKYENENWKGSIKGFRSSISVIEYGKVTLSRGIEVNRPLRYKRYVLYQSGYNPSQQGWTRLQAVRDPGAGIVFAGFILLNIGALLTLFKK
jgi:cytochrome c biogenesis protein